jgi:asparagine synthase (glutamine-hydrolysing)
MCGWVAVFGESVSRELLRAAGDLVATRGPDGAGERILGGPLVGGLAHRRLSIIDLTPAGDQPMVDELSETSVVYNGELYNAPALRRELEAVGVRFRGRSDTEVLLRGWTTWGDDVLDRLEGIFSFALVDERRGRALLARDRMGVKPLYWAQLGSTLVAGSSPSSLMALQPALRDDLDEVALAHYLTLLWIPHPRTPWRAIQKLAPGTAISFEGGETRTFTYWSPPTPDDVPLDPHVLRSTLCEATRAQLLSDVPVGVLFSGGLDSTVLVACLRPTDDTRVSALTAGYDPASQQLEMVPDDLVFARQVARTEPHLDLTEVEIAGDPRVALDAVDRLAPHFDDPVADPAALTLWELCKASGTKVLLSGVGGEELFAGYPRHLALASARRGARLPQAVRRALAFGATQLRGGRAGPAYGPRRNAQKLARALGGDATPHYWRLLAQLTTSELDLLVPGVARISHGALDELCTPLRETSLADALAFDRAQFLPNLNLAYADRSSMASGVEVRVPLLDERLLELVYAADPRRFVAEGVGKVPLRAAAAGLVPESVITRAKTGFGGPVRRWLRGPDAELIRERIEAAADTGLVTRSGARRIYADASTGRVDAALAAWALVGLGAWHDAHSRRNREGA